MPTLLLRLGGPLQSWGASSRFAQRHTRREPTKSGVIGLLAAAQGRRRTDPVEDLLKLQFVVRVDQPGLVIRDFQTAIRWETNESMPLSHRYYLSDALFVAGVEGDADLISALATALERPAFPLFLGRRSCPPTLPLQLEVSQSGVRDAVRQAEWQAGARHRRSRGRRVALEMWADALPGETDGDSVRDVPVSYDPRRRMYGWRDVIRLEPRMIDNPDGREEPDFLAALGA